MPVYAALLMESKVGKMIIWKRKTIKRLKSTPLFITGRKY